MYSSAFPSTSTLYGGGCSKPRPGRFTPGKDLVPIVQEARQAPGPVWTGAENLAPIGIRSPDRPARSESLYRLSYRGPLYQHNIVLKSTVCRHYHCWFLFQKSGVSNLAPKPASLTEDPCGFPQSLRANAGMLLSSAMNLYIDIVVCVLYLWVNLTEEIHRSCR